MYSEKGPSHKAIVAKRNNYEEEGIHYSYNHPQLLVVVNRFEQLVEEDDPSRYLLAL
jgi:hypothetical protein